MKDNTKKLIVLGGLGAVGIYFLTRSDDDAVGGFGGGGGIPLLPGDVADAAEGDTIINYILPEPIEEMPIWDMEEPVTKKMTYAPSIIPTYPLEYYTSGGASELSVAATPAQKTKSVMELQHYGDPFAYLFSGRKEGAPDMESMVKVDDVKKPTVLPGAGLWADLTNYLSADPETRGRYQREVAIKSTKTAAAQYATRKTEQLQFTKGLLGFGTRSKGGSEWTRGSESLSARKASFGGKSIYSTQPGSTRETPYSKKRKSSAPGSPD